MSLAEERLYWITHQRQKVLVEDYSYLKPDEILEVLHASEPIVAAEKQPILILTIQEGNRVNKEVLNEFIRLTKKYEDKIAKSATIGVSGPKVVLFNAFLKGIGKYDTRRLFNNREDALAFLTAP